MPWRDAHTLPFTRIDVVASVPSAPGVYAIENSQSCLLVGETWNLKARLLELASALDTTEALTITYELCAEADLTARRTTLEADLAKAAQDRTTTDKRLPGIRFWDTPAQSAEQ